MKRALLWLAFVVVTSTFILWLTGTLGAAFDWDDGPVKITVSKETTFLEGPLRPDGTVDYIGAVNAPLAELNPNDNAAVLLVRAIGPKAASKETAAEFYRLLKCEAPPEQGEYLVEIDELVKRKKIDDGEILKEYERKQVQFWTAATHPLFAELLTVNEKPLALVVEASRKKTFRTPMVTAKNPPLMIDCRLDVTQALRTAVRLLCLRAMNRLAEGRVDDGFVDLDACHQLANLVGEPPRPLIEGLVATALRGVALRAEQTVALSGRLKPDALRKRGASVAALRPPLHVRESIDQSERMMALDALSNVLTLGSERVFPGGNGLPSLPNVRPPRTTVAYDEALRTVNTAFDDVLKAIEIPDRQKQEIEFTKLEQDFAARGRRAWERQRTFFLFRASPPPNPRGSKAQAGQEAGELLIGNFMPAFRMVVIARWRSLAAQRMTALAYMLAATKAEHGRYPEKLVASELGVQPETLLDPFTGDPFVYRVVDGKRQVVSADMDGVVGPKIKPGDKNATAADRATMKPVDDVVLELP